VTNKTNATKIGWNKIVQMNDMRSNKEHDEEQDEGPKSFLRGAWLLFG
jgi:hypothetical protein